MPILPFGNFSPDTSDYESANSSDVLNVVPRGDGYGPFKAHLATSSALNAACRGMFYARKNDGTIAVFAGTAGRLYLLNNSTQGWTPVSKFTNLTSISNGSPAVVTLNSHGLVVGDPVQFSSTVSLPTGLSTGVTYYVIAAGFTANAFEVSATPGGAAINTSSAGSGTFSATLTYTALSTSANWTFAQFNNFVFAAQQNTVPQVYDLTSSTAFADLAGSPPQAAYIAVVNRFLVLSGIVSPNVYRVQWSGLNATTTWTSGVTQSDFQDLADGGIVRGVAGGEFGVIFQDQSIRRMTYSPGSPYIFGIDRISLDDGLIAPYSLVSASDRLFFLSPQGFKRLDPGGYPVSIGKERIDRAFFADVDAGNLQLIVGANDPRRTRVFWAYKSNAGTSGQFDKVLCYDWSLDKWTRLSLSGEYIGSLSAPGITLEGLDAAYGSNIDTIALSSLDSISNAAISEFAGFNTSHQLGFYTGSNLEATMETGEHGEDGKRLYVRGFRPVTDAATVYGSVSRRETQGVTATYSAESLVNAVGQCPQRVSTRYARGKIRIPSGTAWSFAQGVEPEIAIEGER